MARRVRAPGLQISGNSVGRPGAPTRRGRSSEPHLPRIVVRVLHGPHQPPRNRNRNRNRDRRKPMPIPIPIPTATQRPPSPRRPVASARRICDAPLQKMGSGNRDPGTGNSPGLSSLPRPLNPETGNLALGTGICALATLPGTKARSCSLWFPAVVPEKAGVLTC
jgi:hypothetical protein